MVTPIAALPVKSSAPERPMNLRPTRDSGAALALLGLILSGALVGLDAQEAIRPDLSGVATEDGWTLVNRSATVESEDGRIVATLVAQPGDGVAWLDGVEFGNGTIEVLLRGKNAPGRSFVGIAFRGADDETYDAVYFRPFNFVADNEAGRSHMVQYISHPDNPWYRLRQQHTGVYENTIATPPDPDGFFRARIVIAKPEVRVYVGDAAEPSLVVNELTDRTAGRIGLWTGESSDGSFAELVIRQAGG
jgi:hypothetical protein